MPKTTTKIAERIPSNHDAETYRINGNQSPKYRSIDLFAGAGGLSLGFSEVFGHSFKPVWANDFNKYAAETFNVNFGTVCQFGDILEILHDQPESIPTADIVIGGPPCQGFSLLNKKRAHDPRKQLWQQFMEVVLIAKASVFVMENVPQLLGTEEHESILETARGMGFYTASAKLGAADYGVPQLRHRAFILGCKFADPAEVFPPKKTNISPDKFIQLFAFHDLAEFADDIGPWATVKDAIGDLPKPKGTEIRHLTPPLDLHFGRNPTAKSVERYKAIPEQGMNRFDLQERALHITPECWIRKKSGGTDLFGRLWWDKPALTIRTEFFKPEKGRYLHPEQHRPITHREAARLQSFPDEFKFRGSKIEIAKQIGNAVPPLLAAKIADSVSALMQSRVT